MSMNVPMLQNAPFFLLDTEGVYLSTQALQEVGVDRDTVIYPSLTRYRKAESSMWEHKKIGVNIWIKYDKLPAITKDRVSRHFGDLVRLAAESTLKASALELVEVADVRDFLNMRVRKDGSGYNQGEASDLAHACGWLRLLSRMVENKAFNKPVLVAKDVTIKGKTAFMQWAAGVISSLNLYGFKISNGIRLSGKVDEWNRVEKECLVSRYFGNDNRSVFEPLHLDFLIVHYCKNKKTIPQLVRLLASEFGLQVTRQAVEAQLDKPENKQKWMPVREGLLNAEKRSRSMLTIAKPQFADAIWQVDASPIALFANDGNGVKKSKYTTVFIRDTYSGKCVGLAFGITETAELVKTALRHAVTNTGFLPHSLRYDGGSANISGEIKTAMDILSMYHFKTAPYRPTGKASIEQFVNQVELVLKGFDNFAGGNITRRGTEKSFNPDVVKAMQKAGAMPTSEQTMIQVWAAVEILNNRTDGTGKTPNEKYNQSTHEKRRKATIEIVAQAFWNRRERSIRYEMGGIKMELNGTKLQYWVGTSMVEDFDFKRRHEGKKFYVRINPQNLQIIALYDDKDRFVAQAILKHEYSLLPDMRAEGEGEGFAIMQEQNKRWITEGVQGFEESKNRLIAAELPTEYDFMTLNKEELGRVESGQLERLLDVVKSTTKKREKKAIEPTKTLQRPKDEGDKNDIDFYSIFSK